MKTHAQVVVIGGGLIGCSILYHLAKLGCKDCMLLERDELTSGSTWHAAAGVHGLHDHNNTSRLQYYTMKTYADLERETGQSCGVHQPGSIYLACTRERVHQLRIQAAKARAFDAEFYEISRDEIRELHPLLQTDDVLCAMFEPLGGHVDPSGVTHAYAQGARKLGAEIMRFAPVVETNARGGGWDVVTQKGTVHAEVVVNAAGLWAREVAALAGISLPLLPTEHQYFVTESIPAIAELGRELPAVADRDGEYYMRQEGDGLLVGAYEKGGKVWSEQVTPADFGHDLLQVDFDRIEENVLRACARVPALAEAGVKRAINGPMIWSPDSAALVGPAHGLRNYFLCCGIIPGFSQSAGLGLTLAQWILDGEPELDMFAWDVARFGDWANQKFTRARVLDTYSSRFRIHFPFEERDAGRPLKTRPVYDLQKSLGAVFGLSYGWEHAQWFAGEGVDARDDYSFERAKWFAAAGAECKAVRASAGVVDTSNFAKYEITGKGALGWLDSIIANHVPQVDGRTCLTPLLGARGGVAGDFTVARLTSQRLFMVGSGIAEHYHRRMFESALPAKDVAFRPVTGAYAGFNIAGPNAREILQRVTGVEMPNDALPFMRNRVVQIDGYEAILIRVSFTGDLGYEIYAAQENQLALYRALLQHGAEFNIAPVGSRALGSMRIEKGYGSWSREYSPEWFPHESGLARLVKDKPAFFGRDAWRARMHEPPRQLLCAFAVDTENADAFGGETITCDGEYAGRVTSGAYGFSVDTSLALGYIDAKMHARENAQYEIAVLGKPHAARLLREPLFDPKGERMRG